MDMCLQLDHRLVVGCTVAQLTLNGANSTTAGAFILPHSLIADINQS